MHATPGRAFALLFPFLALMVQGCADRSLLRFQKIGLDAGKDNYTSAIAEVRKSKSLYGSESQLLYHMDLGALFHYAGDYDSSILELSQAVQIHDDLFAHSVSNEALSLLTNDNIRPYRGKPHEIVLLHELLAFDYLALGKYDDALVEARQAQLYLDEVKRKAGKDEKTYNDDGMFRYLSGIAYEAQRQKDDAAIAMYQAVKAYRGGPIPLPPSVARNAYVTLKAADRKDDIKELHLDESAEGSGSQAAGGPAMDPNQSEIIVVGHAGRAPDLGQSVSWGTWVRDGVLVIHYHDSKGKEVTEALPAPGLPPQPAGKGRRGKTRSGTTFHVKFSMPQIKDVYSRTRFFTVAGEASPTPVRTEALTDLNPLLSSYLDATHTATLLRTVVRVLTRTIAAEETKSAISGQNPILNLILNIGTDVLSDQLEQADTRTWFLLPRTVQMVRIPVTPGKHSIKVEAHDGSGNTLASRSFDDIEVKPGEKKFVFMASLK